MSAYVYIIGKDANGPVKVGFSTNHKKRIASIQSSNPSPLQTLKIYRLGIENASKLERAIHHNLISKRIEGEWFSCSLSDVVKIVDIIRKETKSFRNWSNHEEAAKSGLMKLIHKDAAKKREKISRNKCNKIKSRWVLPNKEHSTASLLNEAGIVYNTAVKFLGPRPIAQYKYQAAQKRKVRKGKMWI